MMIMRGINLSKYFSIPFKDIFKSLGPGLTTGAADEDPATIGTYSQAGAQFGLGMLWLALFQYPMIVIVQEMCARIGLVTGSGLGAVLKKKYSKKIVLMIASLILIANTINIGADIGAMAASVRVLIPQMPFVLATLSFTAFIVLSEMLIPYRTYARILNYLAISLLAYIITAIIVGGNLEHILAATIIPHFEFTSDFAMMFVAIFGATLTPYAFFWHASQEAEEDIVKHKIKEVSGIGNSPQISKKEMMLMRSDVVIGMGLSQLVMWSIIITTAITLNANNITNIQTADQAARALQPLVNVFPGSGTISKTIFALGIIGTGLLAIPVMAGASGYALSDVFGWSEGLNKSFLQAKKYYLIKTASTIIGLLINFTNIDPIRALVYSSVINGIVAAPILVAVINVANDKKILRDQVNSKLSNVIGWIVVVIMVISVVILFLTWKQQ